MKSFNTHNGLNFEDDHQKQADEFLKALGGDFKSTMELLISTTKQNAKAPEETIAAISYEMILESPEVLEKMSNQLILDVCTLFSKEQLQKMTRVLNSPELDVYKQKRVQLRKMQTAAGMEAGREVMQIPGAQEKFEEKMKKILNLPEDEDPFLPF